MNYRKWQDLAIFSLNTIIKGSGTSFKSLGLNQKHVRNVFHAAHQYFIKFHFDST